MSSPKNITAQDAIKIESATPQTPILAVAFDLDGLMFNTEELYEYVGAVVLERRGKVFTAELLEQMIGLRTPIALQKMVDFHHLNDTPETLQIESNEIFREIIPTRLKPMPGLLRLLEQLEEANIPKGVATSSPREFTQMVLGQFDMLPRFQFLLTSEDVTEGKPDPEIYQKAAEMHKIAPNRMLVFEDSSVGCQAASAAGAITVAVPHGHTQNHSFSGATFIADTLADPQIAALLNF